MIEFVLELETPTGTTETTQTNINGVVESINSAIYTNHSDEELVRHLKCLKTNGHWTFFKCTKTNTSVNVRKVRK